MCSKAEMQWVGTSYLLSPTVYQHKCTACGSMQSFLDVYPKLFQERTVVNHPTKNRASNLFWEEQLQKAREFMAWIESETERLRAEIAAEEAKGKNDFLAPPHE